MTTLCTEYRSTPETCLPVDSKLVHTMTTALCANKKASHYEYLTTISTVNHLQCLSRLLLPCGSVTLKVNHHSHEVLRHYLCQ